jgi:hypothetical protein
MNLADLRSAVNTNQFTKGHPIATKKAGLAAEAATKTVNLNPSLSGHRTAAYTHSLAADHHAAALNPNQERYHRKMAEHHASMAAIGSNLKNDKKDDKKAEPKEPKENAKNQSKAVPSGDASGKVTTPSNGSSVNALLSRIAGAFPENSQRLIEQGPFKVGSSVMINAPGHDCHGQIGSITKCMPEAFNVSVNGSHAGTFPPAQLRVTGSLSMNHQSASGARNDKAKRLNHMMVESRGAGGPGSGPRNKEGGAGLSKAAAGELAQKYADVHNAASKEYTVAFKESGARMWRDDRAHPLKSEHVEALTRSWTKQTPKAIDSFHGLPRPLTVMDQLRGQLHEKLGVTAGDREHSKAYTTVTSAVDKIHSKYEKQWNNTLFKGATLNLASLRDRILGGPGSGQTGHTTEHQAAAGLHEMAQRAHQAAMAAHHNSDPNAKHLSEVAQDASQAALKASVAAGDTGIQSQAKEAFAHASAASEHRDVSTHTDHKAAADEHRAAMQSHAGARVAHRDKASRLHGLDVEGAMNRERAATLNELVQRVASNPEGINQYTKAASSHEIAATAHDTAAKLNDNATNYNERVKAHEASKDANGATNRAKAAWPSVNIGRADAAVAHADRAVTRSREAKESNTKIYATGIAHREAASAHRDVAAKLKKAGGIKTFSNPTGINQYSGAAAHAHDEAAKAHEAAAIRNISSSAAEKASRVAGNASDKVTPGTAFIKRPDGMRETNASTSAGKAMHAAYQAREAEKRSDNARGPQAAQSAMATRAKYHQEAAGHHRDQAEAHRGTRTLSNPEGINQYTKGGSTAKSAHDESKRNAALSMAAHPGADHSFGTSDAYHEDSRDASKAHGEAVAYLEKQGFQKAELSVTPGTTFSGGLPRSSELTNQHMVHPEGHRADVMLGRGVNDTVDVQVFHKLAQGSASPRKSISDHPVRSWVQDKYKAASMNLGALVRTLSNPTGINQYTGGNANGGANAAKQALQQAKRSADKGRAWPGEKGALGAAASSHTTVDEAQQHHSAAVSYLEKQGFVKGNTRTRPEYTRGKGMPTESAETEQHLTHPNGHEATVLTQSGVKDSAGVNQSWPSVHVDVIHKLKSDKRGLHMNLASLCERVLGGPGSGPRKGGGSKQPSWADASTKKISDQIQALKPGERLADKGAFEPGKVTGGIAGDANRLSERAIGSTNPEHHVDALKSNQKAASDYRARAYTESLRGNHDSEKQLRKAAEYHDRLAEHHNNEQKSLSSRNASANLTTLSNPEGINQYTNKSVGAVKPGDTVHDSVGRPMLHVTGVDNARQSGYKIFTGISVRGRGDAGVKPGGKDQWSAGHKSGTLSVSTGHPDHPMTPKQTADQRRYSESVKRNTSPPADAHNRGVTRVFNPKSRGTSMNLGALRDLIGDGSNQYGKKGSGGDKTNDDKKVITRGQNKMPGLNDGVKYTGSGRVKTTPQARDPQSVLKTWRTHDVHVDGEHIGRVHTTGGGLWSAAHNDGKGPKGQFGSSKSAGNALANYHDKIKTSRGASMNLAQVRDLIGNGNNQYTHSLGGVTKQPHIGNSKFYVSRGEASSGRDKPVAGHDTFEAAFKDASNRAGDRNDHNVYRSADDEHMSTHGSWGDELVSGHKLKDALVNPFKALRGDGSNQYGHKGSGGTGGKMPYESPRQRRGVEPTGKDAKRISDIVKKSAGSDSKKHALAQQMANSIDDPAKAKRRAYAASDLGHSTIAQIFHDRHAELTGRARAATLATLRARIRALQFEEGDEVEIDSPDDDNDGEIGVVTSADDDEYEVEDADGNELGTYVESELKAASLKTLGFSEGDDVVVKATGEAGVVTSVDGNEYDVEDDGGEDLGTFSGFELKAAARRNLGGPGSGSKGHTTQHDKAVANHEKAQGAHEAATARREAWVKQQSESTGRSKHKDQMIDYNVDRMHDYAGKGTFSGSPVKFNKGGNDYSGQGHPADGVLVREGLKSKGWTEKPTATGTTMVHPDGKAQVRFEPHGKRSERTYIEPRSASMNLGAVRSAIKSLAQEVSA